MYPILKLDSGRRLHGTSELTELFRHVGRERSFGTVHDAAFYFGTPGRRNRKIVMLLLGESGERLGFVKIPDGEPSLEYIRREARVVQSLAHIKWQHLLIPPSITLRRLGSEIVSHQADIFNETRYMGLSLTSPLTAAAVELAEQTRRSDIGEYLDALEKRWTDSGFQDRSTAEWRAAGRRLRESGVPTVQVHGDFVPYNVRMGDDVIHIVDWEFSRRGLPLYDLFHYQFQGAVQIHHRAVRFLIPSILRNLRMGDYLERLQIPGSCLKDLFRLYLMDFMLFDRKNRVNTHEDSPFREALHWLDKNHG